MITATRGSGFSATKVAHTARDRAAELQAEVRSAIRVLHGWCPRPPQGHARGETVLMSPQSQIRGNHRNGGPPPPPPATVVVSSTSSMRPPPPPPPPRARTSNESKGHHEEPTSSIPDLGEASIQFSSECVREIANLASSFASLRSVTVTIFAKIYRSISRANRRMYFDPPFLSASLYRT